MTVEKVLAAQAARFVSTRTANLYVRDLVQALRERYEFVHVPTTAEELVPEEGTPSVYLHGRLVRQDRTIVIHRLEVHRQALVVQTGLTTDDSDLILDDLIKEGQARGWVTAVSPPRLYVSQLEFRLEASLDDTVSASRLLAERWMLAMRAYGFSLPAGLVPRVIGVALQPDPQAARLPVDFRIERREGVSYDDNLYFSQAPLRTSDHIALLEEFDRAVIATVRKATA